MAISYQRTQSVIKVIFGAEKPQQPETRPESTNHSYEPINCSTQSSYWLPRVVHIRLT